MNTKLTKLMIVLSALSLAACDKPADSKKSDSTTNSDTTTSTTSTSSRAADGYLKNADVCIDLNQNLRCDSDEPSTTTGAGGVYKFDNLTAEQKEKKAKSTIIVKAVANQTIDEDKPDAAITEGYTLTAAGNSTSGFVSPLTTMFESVRRNNPTLSDDALRKKVLKDLKLPVDTDFDSDFVAKKDKKSHKMARNIASTLAKSEAKVRNKLGDNFSEEDFLAIQNQIEKIIFKNIDKIAKISDPSKAKGLDVGIKTPADVKSLKNALEIKRSQKKVANSYELLVNANSTNSSPSARSATSSSRISTFGFDIPQPSASGGAGAPTAQPTSGKMDFSLQMDFKVITLNIETEDGKKTIKSSNETYMKQAGQTAPAWQAKTSSAPQLSSYYLSDDGFAKSTVNLIDCYTLQTGSITDEDGKIRSDCGQGVKFDISLTESDVSGKKIVDVILPMTSDSSSSNQQGAPEAFIKLLRTVYGDAVMPDGAKGYAAVYKPVHPRYTLQCGFGGVGGQPPAGGGQPNAGGQPPAGGGQPTAGGQQQAGGQPPQQPAPSAAAPSCSSLDTDITDVTQVIGKDKFYGSFFKVKILGESGATKGTAKYKNDFAVLTLDKNEKKQEKDTKWELRDVKGTKVIVVDFPAEMTRGHDGGKMILGVADGKLLSGMLESNTKIEFQSGPTMFNNEATQAMKDAIAASREGKTFPFKVKIEIDVIKFDDEGSQPGAGGKGDPNAQGGGAGQPPAGGGQGGQPPAGGGQGGQPPAGGGQGGQPPAGGGQGGQPPAGGGQGGQPPAGGGQP